MSTPSRWLLPSAVALLAVFLFWLYAFFMPNMMNGDGDLGRHLVIGEVVMATGRIPTEDIFSHTMAGTPMVPHEWLSEVLFALAYRLAGFNGVAWLTGAVLTATYTLLAADLRQRGVNALLAATAGFAAAVVGFLHALTRPHIFTLLCFVLMAAALERYRTTGNWKRWLLPLLPLMTIWANLHGAFLTGLMIAALYLVGAVLHRERQQAITLALLLVGLLVAASINPAGPSLLTHSAGYLGNDFLVSATDEYRSPDFHSTNMWPFAALLLTVIVLLGRSTLPVAWGPLLALAAWAGFALYSARNIPLFAILGAAQAAWLGQTWLEAALPAFGRQLARFDALDRRSGGWVWPLGVALLLMVLTARGQPVDPWGVGNRIDPKAFPVAAIDTMEREGMPAGKMFNEFAWGGYILHRLWPTHPVYIDAQTDFYGEALTREFLDISGAKPGWQGTLARRDISWILIPPWRALASELSNHPDEWRLYYSDDVAQVWVKR